LQDPNGPTPQSWEGGERVTVLVMGLDLRDYEEGGAARTDTMLLMSVDPNSRTASILSIPRDLWVNIPGYDYGKINTAYYIGEIYDLPGGGPAMAIQTVEQLLGVPINYYARIDFNAFVAFIDQIGGIEVEVPDQISVDPIGPHNTVTLDAGLQRLDGATALAYARNRDTAGGDFDRAQRQQQVILAIRNRILNLKMLPMLIENAPALYQQLSSGVHTNMSLDELVRLAWLASEVPVENIERAAITFDQVTQTYSADGMDILLPDPDKIRELRDELFTESGAIAPAATEVVGDPAELMAQEAANVSVLNATFTIGLAATTGDYLKDAGINITYTGNADEAAELSAIIDYTGNPYTVQRLVELLKIQPSRIYTRYDPNSSVDIAVLVGEDWATDNPMP
jgi:LCP family protein required for cell wall assembly